MVETPGIQRKLTTILAADASNYSGRMARDEVGTVQALRGARALIDSTINDRRGRIANTSGDGLIAEFPSVVEAVAAAIVIQRALNSDHDGLRFRIGLHLGDVIVEGTDLLGEGVNTAARLQDMAPRGGIFASQQVVDHARGRLTAEFRPLRPTALKNTVDEIAIYGVIAEGVAAPDDLARLRPSAKMGQPPETVKPSSRTAVVKARDKLLFASAGTAIMAIALGPWMVFAFAPMLAVFFWKWWRLRQDLIAPQGDNPQS